MLDMVHSARLGNDLDVNDLRRRIWRELFILSQPIQIGMYGDMFDDARFLIENLDSLPEPGWGNEFMFLWGVRPMGTDVSTMDENGLGSEWFECSREYNTSYNIVVSQDQRGEFWLTAHLDNR